MEICRVNGSFRDNGRLVGVASRTSSPCSFPIRIWEEIWQVNGLFFDNGRLVGVASRTSTGPSAKIGSICGIVDCDGFPCFNFSKSEQGVGKTIWNWHDLLGRNHPILSAICLYVSTYAYLTVGRAVMISETKWP